MVSGQILGRALPSGGTELHTLTLLLAGRLTRRLCRMMAVYDGMSLLQWPLLAGTQR